MPMTFGISQDMHIASHTIESTNRYEQLTVKVDHFWDGKPGLFAILPICPGGYRLGSLTILIHIKYVNIYSIYI